MAGVFDIDIDDGMQRAGGPMHPNRQLDDDDEETNGIDIELKEEYTHGPDIRAMNASILKDPCYETVELSERTVKGRCGNKAGPQGEFVFHIFQFVMRFFQNLKFPFRF